MKKEELQAQCHELAFTGKDYLFIKKVIDQTDFSEEEKIQLLVDADGYIAHYQIALQEKSKALQQMIMGFTLLLFAGTYNLYSYFSVGEQYYLLDGLILVGAWILKEGYEVYQIPLEERENPLDKIYRKIQR